MRQLGLTFWGESRTEEAKHANLGQGIVSVTMTISLIMLAFFALTAGFVGVPSDFPIFGAIFSPEHSPLPPFCDRDAANQRNGTTIRRSARISGEAPPFNALPVAASFIVALGGLYARLSDVLAQAVEGRRTRSADRR